MALAFKRFVLLAAIILALACLQAEAPKKQAVDTGGLKNKTVAVEPNNQTVAVITPNASIVIPPTPSPPGLCGDGTCDVYEQQSGICPADCNNPAKNASTALPGAGNVSSVQQGFCGDGVCDSYEQQGGFCAKDCPASAGNATGAAGNASFGASSNLTQGAGNVSPVQQGFCGDGVCDAYELQINFCAKDCQAANVSGSAGNVSSVPQGLCGDGVCDSYERQGGFCAKDCPAGQ